MQCSVYKSPKEQAKEDGKWNRSRVNFEKEKKTVVAKSVQDLFCMQTVPSDQHVWKYFLKTRKTRINLKSGFPFESGSIESIGLSISKLLTEQPFKPFMP